MDYPYWHPCLYSRYSKSSFMWNVYLVFAPHQFYDSLWLLTLKRSKALLLWLLPKIDNEMNSDENWWLMMICLLNTPIHPHWQHNWNNWHLKQKMRLFNPSSWRWCLPNFWCLPCWWSVLGNWAGWWSISFGLLWRRISLGRKLPFHSYLEGIKV